MQDENFKLHPDKLRIMKRNQRQEVTGVVVNEKVNVNKKNIKRFRALLHQIESQGIKGKTWNGGDNVLAEIDGYANFIYQVHSEKGIKYKERVAKILEANEYKKAHRAAFVHEKPKKKSFFQRIISIFKS